MSEQDPGKSMASSISIFFLAVSFLLILPPDAGAAQDCKHWSRYEFWKQASPADVTRCLEAGADLEAQFQGRTTPLNGAVSLGNAEVVKVLLDAGANHEVRVAGGRTLLHIAAMMGNVETVKALLDAGADPKVRDYLGWTLLHIAATSRSAETVRIFLDEGLDLDAQDKIGWTPLHMAAWFGIAESVRVLLDAGADPGVRTEDGRLAVDLAEGNKDVRDDPVFGRLRDAKDS